MSTTRKHNKQHKIKLIIAQTVHGKICSADKND